MGGSSLRDRLQLGFGRTASEMPVGPPKLLAASLRFQNRESLSSRSWLAHLRLLHSVFGGSCSQVTQRSCLVAQNSDLHAGAF